MLSAHAVHYVLITVQSVKVQIILRGCVETDMLTANSCICSQKTGSLSQSV